MAVQKVPQLRLSEQAHELVAGNAQALQTCLWVLDEILKPFLRQRGHDGFPMSGPYWATGATAPPVVSKKT